MNLSLKLVVEKHTTQNIWIATKEGDIPESIVNDCPKQVCANLLYDITNYRIDPYLSDWLCLELHDIIYNKDTETAYVVYVCRVPPETELQVPFEWKTYAETKSKLDDIKGVL